MLLTCESLPFISTLISFFKSLDYSILSFINSIAGRSWYFDNFVRFICDSQVLKSGIIVALLWWFWFCPGDDHKVRATREKVVAALAAAVVALFLARSLAFLLPFRARPIADATFGFKSWLGASPNTLMGWSSFPSDHAVLFFSLAMSIWYISRRLGWVLFGYVFVLICLPRIYLGLHYPTDILAGAPLGISVAWFFYQIRARNPLAVLSLRCAQESPPLFYAGFFVLSYEIAELFDQTRMVGKFIYFAFRHLFIK